MTGPGAGRRPTRRLAVLAAAAVVPLVLLPGLNAAPAAAAEPCVGVIVDARLLGGGVSTGCADGDPDSGLDALAAAGFGYAFAPRVPGFVCQIDTAPECARTSTTTYWSYWHRAKDSAPWVYSSAGAGSHDPAPGSTEAWVWQDGGRREPPDVALESICPQVAAARTERATPSTPAGTSPTAATALREAPEPPTSSAGAKPSGPEPTGSKPSGSAPSASASAPTAATTPTAVPPSSAAVAARERAGDGPAGSPWTGVVLGGSLIAALGGAAMARSRRSGGRP